MSVKKISIITACALVATVSAWATEGKAVPQNVASTMQHSEHKVMPTDMKQQLAQKLQAKKMTSATNKAAMSEVKLPAGAKVVTPTMSQTSNIKVVTPTTAQPSDIKVVTQATTTKTSLQVEKAEGINIIRPAGTAKTQAKVVKLQSGKQSISKKTTSSRPAAKSNLQMRLVYADGTPVPPALQAAAAKQLAKEKAKKAKDAKKQKKDKKDKNSKHIEERAFYYGVMLPRDYKDISIYGESECAPGQAVAYLRNNNPQVKLSCTPEKLVQLYWEEANKEGVRPDLAFCQAITETGFFRFGGDVFAKQNNFCGLGTTGGGVKGAHFKTPQLGVRAHIQHLLAYSRMEKPKTAIVDPRYSMAHDLRVQKGLVNEWSGLNGTWAMGSEYCEKIMYHYANMLKTLATKDMNFSTTKTNKRMSSKEQLAKHTRK